MQRHSPGAPPATGHAAALAHWLFVALVAAAALWRPASLAERLEGPLVDGRFRARNAYASLRTGSGYAPPAPPRFVIVTVDKELKDPDTSWVAHLLEKIGKSRPRAIGIDLPLRDVDAATKSVSETLASAALRGRTAAAVKTLPGPQAAGAVPERLLAGAITRVARPERLRPAEASQALPPAAPIAAATVFGHTVAEPDDGGTVRRERLYLRCGGALLPSLALQTARIAHGLQPQDVQIRGNGEIDFGGTRIPADREGRMLISYYDDNDGEGPFPRYTADSVLTGETEEVVFEDAVVFIGSTDIASIDRRPVNTPFGRPLPAVEKDATVAANILGRDFLREAPPAVDLLVVLLAGLAVPLLVRRRAAFSLLSLLGLAAALVAVNVALFLRGFQLALAWPLLALVVPGGGAVLWQHVAELRVARRMRRLFSSYVTERVLERLIADPALARPGGERREVTILFADIRGFTSFSEKHPPEEVVRTLNEYLEAMTDVIFRWEGTLDKFIGDTILAFWGAPLPQEDHAARALRCALELCERLDGLNAVWAAAGRPALEIGIGVTTGQVLVGNIGAEGKKMDYTIIGDQVNLCSRVEQLTKTYRARILVTASTFARLERLIDAGGFGHLAVEELADVTIKGREEPVSLYRIWPRRHGMPTSVEKSGAAAPGA